MLTSYNFSDKIPKGVLTCNPSDAMNQKGSLSYFKVLNCPQSSVYGTAVTYETSAGDWCAVVKAIGTLRKGDVFVAKSIGGTGSAVMGEPMVNSAKIRERQQLLLMGHLETFPNSKNLQFPSTQVFCLKCRESRRKRKDRNHCSHKWLCCKPGWDNCI